MAVCVRSCVCLLCALVSWRVLDNVIFMKASSARGNTETSLEQVLDPDELEVEYDVPSALPLLLHKVARSLDITLHSSSNSMHAWLVNGR